MKSARLGHLLDVLLDQAPVQDVPAGAMLFSQGDPADRFFLVVSGKVRLYVAEPSGGETLLHVFSDGEFFGLPAMVGLKRYPVNGEALTMCRLVVASRAAVLARLAAEPGRVTAMLGALSARYLGMARDLAELKVLSPTQRICCYLLRAADRAGAPLAEGEVRFRLDVQHNLIAASVGLAPENLSRAFRRLTTLGIHVHRSEVLLEDVRRLRDHIASAGD
ncbi:MAG: Crp/Fnr family transcriptional regulator [Alphaproteobacteria bacterium]|nr:Crp/Fnr family transcriptional regulator [Alphaproteobacteria bacterium]